jgi:hypothetical protein
MAIDISNPGGNESALEAALRERTLDGLAQFGTDLTTSREWAAADTGKAFLFEGASDITMTVPNDLPRGWVVSVIVIGDGNVVIASEAGATTLSLLTEIFGSATLLVYRNTSGTGAEYSLKGDLE